MAKTGARKPARKPLAKPRLVKIHDLRKMEIFRCDGEDLLPSWAITPFHGAPCQVEPSGRRCFVAAAMSAEVFIGVYDLKRGRLSEVLAFRAAMFRGVPELSVDDQTLTLHCRSEWLKLSTLTWDVIGSHDLEEFDGEDTSSAFLVPGFRFWWQQLDDDDEERYRIVDLEKRRVCRELEGWGAPMLVPGEELRIVSAAPCEGGLYDPSGALLSTGSFDDRSHYSIHPEGPQLIAMGHSSDDAHVLSLTMVDESGETVSPELILPGTIAEQRSGLATSRERGLVFAMFRVRDGDELAAFAVSETRMELLYRIAIQPPSALLQDVQARHVVLMASEHEAARVALLSRALPDSLEPDRGDVLPDAGEFRRCGRFSDPVADPSGQQLLLTRKPEERATLRQAFVEAHRSNPARLLAFAAAVSRHQADDWNWINSWILARWKDHSAVRLQLAQRKVCDDNDWPEALALLSRPHTGELSPAHRDHARHLMAIAHLKAGNPAAALEVMEAGPETHQDACRLKRWKEWAEALAAPLSIADRSSRPRRLVLGLREADANLSRGDAAGALAALDRGGAWGLPESPVLARYVKAFGLQEDAAGLDRFRARFARAAFLEVLSDSTLRESLPWCDLALPADELEAVAKQAVEWLDA